MKIDDILGFIKYNDINAVYLGDADAIIECISSLNSIKKYGLCWIKNKDYVNNSLIEELRRNKAIVVSPFKIKDVNCIVTDYPKGVYFKLLDEFFSTKMKHVISDKATVLTNNIGENVHIGENCYLSEEVSVGDNTIIFPNVSIISRCTIGKDCIIYPGVVIGSDGFGYYFDENGLPKKVDHFGGVSIGNRVEIGANTCIDRGTIDDTLICDDVKIDNLVHIAHNSIIHNGALVIAGAIICGSAEIGELGYVAPGSIIKNQIHIGDNALIGLGAVVLKDVKKDMVAVGMPAKEVRVVQKGDK